MLNGSALKEATHRLAAETRERIRGQQSGVPTFSDNIFLSLVEQLDRLDQNLPWEESVERLAGPSGQQLKEALAHLQHFLSRRSAERLVNYHDRFVSTPSGPRSESAISAQELIMSQGVSECMHWKGLPIFKTVFDFSIYTMMMWELKPKTVIEIGSGTGSSAVWMADTLKALGLEAHVYSADLKKAPLEYEGVTFIQGNCWVIERAFTSEFLRNAPHPWLFIEDAHVNVHGVLSHFHPHFQKGDYMVVEDSLHKQDVLSKFMKQNHGCYKLDTRYTDFFGRNATCSHDSIFVRV
jgi:cephalosporin hydroxylase